MKDEWRALETEHLSLWELYEGNLEERLLYWGPRRICQVRVWKWACFHGGGIMGNMGGRSFPRAFESRVKFLYIMRTFIEEFGRRAKEGSGKGQLSP
jgi:hypothetical protein